MPQGVETFIDGGLAVVDFVDPSLKGPALAKLIELGGPESIETITRDGPRRKYRVPEGNARAVGLVDNLVDATASGDQGHAKALADADPVTSGGVYSPEVPTVKGANDAGPVTQAAVAGSQSIITTESDTGTPAEVLAPLHSEVITTVTERQRPVSAALAARRAELEGQVHRSGLPTIASQTGALATDPQSRPTDVVDRAAEQSAATTPTMDWTRAQIDAHAADVHGIDTTAEPNKGAALDAIEGAKS